MPIAGLWAVRIDPVHFQARLFKADQTWVWFLADHCLSVTFMYCGQMVGWIKVPLGMEVGLSPGHIVLDRLC